jgi:hypothetical protein
MSNEQNNFVGSAVGVICSVKGDVVTDVFGSSSNWDYVTYPSAGWVAEEYVNTSNQIAPRCS